MSKLRVLFIGDVVGVTGRTMFAKHIQRVKQKHNIDAIVVNGENSSNHGRGITPQIVKFFKENGANVITSGNHIWFKRDIYSYLDTNQDLLKPANFPSATPGTGVTTFTCNNTTVAIVNLQGRIFMREQVECPFKTAESILTYLKHKTNIIFVDFHAEATAEKIGLGFHLDGKISGMVGTHTHVPTADERMLPNGTAFVTDLGMTGALHSMIGMKKEPILNNMITQMPVRFEVETQGPGFMTGVWIEVDTQTGKATDIQRVKVVDNELNAQ